MHCDNVSEDEGTRSCKRIPFNTGNFTRDKKKKELRLAMKLQRRGEYPTIRKRDYKKINEHIYKIQKEDSNRGAENEYAN